MHNFAIWRPMEQTTYSVEDGSKYGVTAPHILVLRATAALLVSFLGVVMTLIRDTSIKEQCRG